MIGLSPGSYSLDAVLEGFDSITYPNIAISVGRNTEIEVPLNPAVVEDEAFIEEPAEAWISLELRVTIEVAQAGRNSAREGFGQSDRNQGKGT